MTHYEAWYYQKPNVSHLKVFEYIFHTLIDRDDHGKIDKKSKKYIFLGYNDNNKDYH